MQVDTRKLVTIVTEASLEQRLLGDLDRLGAHGYTVSDARGRGSRGSRDGGWEASRNIRIEVVCDAALAGTIATHLRTRYYDDYAMILYVADVAVLRPEKF